MKSAARTCGLVVACALSFTPAAQAQEYRAKTVRMLVTLPAGSSSDIVARILGENLSRALGQQFIVDNRPGAAGNIAAALAAKAPADGYTLLLSTISTHGTNPWLYSQLGFEPIKDFVPVVLLASNPNVLVVLPSTPARSVKELIALARARPGEVTYASGGAGTSQHMAGEFFNLLAEANKALKLAAVREKLNDQGLEVHGGTAQDYGRFIDAELARWGKVVKAAGIRIE